MHINVNGLRYRFLKFFREKISAILLLMNLLYVVCYLLSTARGALFILDFFSCHRGANLNGSKVKTKAQLRLNSRK